MLRDVRSQLGCAIVVIEHDLPLVLGLADRLAVLDQGALLRVGPPNETMADPAVIAAYLGADEPDALLQGAAR